MITTINEWKLLNENLEFNINDIKQNSRFYQKILDFGFTDITTDLQYKNGTINFIANQPNNIERTNPLPRDRDNYLEYIIYSNGKIRRASPSIFNRGIGISFDLKRDIENIQDIDLIFQKIISSIEKEIKQNNFVVFNLQNTDTQYDDNERINLIDFDLKNLFDLINKECFDNSLPNIRIELAKNASSHKDKSIAHFSYLTQDTGKLICNKIVFNTTFKLTYKQIKNTMAHEMIHYYIAYNNINDNDSHGLEFEKEMNRINNLNLGYNITKTLNDTEKHINQFYVFITFKNKKNKGFSIIELEKFNAKFFGKIIKKHKLEDINIYQSNSENIKENIKEIHAIKTLEDNEYYCVLISKEQEYLLDEITNDTTNTRKINTIKYNV